MHQSLSSVPIRLFSSTNHTFAMYSLFQNMVSKWSLFMPRNFFDCVLNPRFCHQSMLWFCIQLSYCEVHLVFHETSRCLQSARCFWWNTSLQYLCQVHSLILTLFQIHYAGAADSSVQFIFYQPIIHRWRETDFFPCSASCGGGNELPLYFKSCHLHT